MAFEQVKDLETRREQAISLLLQHKDISHIVFKMLNGQNYSEEIWDLVKPAHYVQPFSCKYED
jgi:hypothetical protein